MRHHLLDRTPPSLAQAIPCLQQHFSTIAPLLESEALMTAAASSLWPEIGMGMAQRQRIHPEGS